MYTYMIRKWHQPSSQEKQSTIETEAGLGHWTVRITIKKRAQIEG